MGCWHNSLYVCLLVLNYFKSEILAAITSNLWGNSGNNWSFCYSMVGDLFANLALHHNHDTLDLTWLCAVTSVLHDNRHRGWVPHFMITGMTRVSGQGAAFKGLQTGDRGQKGGTQQRKKKVQSEKSHSSAFHCLGLALTDLALDRGLEISRSRAPLLLDLDCEAALCALTFTTFRNVLTELMDSPKLLFPCKR